jgi:DNA recombination protein RmuC
VTDIALIALVAALAALLATLFVVLRGGAAGKRELTELLGRLAQLNEDSRAAQAALKQELGTRLDAVSAQLGDGMKETAEKTAKTIGELHTRLGVIDAAQKNIAELSSRVVGLQDILANKQARGAFGEIQLADLVRNALPPSAYSFQTTLGNGKRADCLIVLPNPPGPIVIDAKFPLESFHALRAARDEAARVLAGRAFSADILKHVRDIAQKYILPGETAESALMFLPSEAVYAELHANFPAVVEKSYREKVWIVSPTTLMATLNTVRAVLKDVRMREQAGLIQAEVGLLMADIARLEKRAASLAKHFGLAEKDLREIDISTGKITRRAGRIEEVQLKDDGAGKEGGETRLDIPTSQLLGD